MSYKSVVTFTPVGRLGNFLFEAASALSYAWKHNLEVSIPKVTRDAEWHPVYLPHLVNSRFDPSFPEIHVKQKVFSYHPRPFEPQWAIGHNIFLDGYWQTEKYFKEYRSRLLSSFGFPWSPIKKTVSVHVRRGDYLTIKRGEIFKHPPLSVEWYHRQMKKFPNHSFAFFSDDLEWCRQNFPEHVKHGSKWAPFPGEKWELSQEERDLVGMSCCEHHICSASTFSWWGAWLNQNPNKRVIMPTHWINPKWDPTMDQSDIVPKEWERA